MVVGGLGTALLGVVSSLLPYFLEVIFWLLKSGNILLDGSYDTIAQITIGCTILHNKIMRYMEIRTSLFSLHRPFFGQTWVQKLTLCHMGFIFSFVNFPR